MKQIALDRFGIDEIISLYKDKSVIKVLLALGDNFPKLILTMDDLPIVRKNIREWILEGVKGGASIQIQSAI